MLFYGTSHNLLYRWVVKGSDLDAALQGVKGLERCEVSNPHSSKSRYVQYKPASGRVKRDELAFSLFKRESRVEDEHWHECFWIDVDLNGRSVYREKIPVDHKLLEHLESIPIERQRRNGKLLEIAERVLRRA